MYHGTTQCVLQSQLVVKDIGFVIAGLPVMSFILAWTII